MPSASKQSAPRGTRKPASLEMLDPKARQADIKAVGSNLVPLPLPADRTKTVRVSEPSAEQSVASESISKVQPKTKGKKIKKKARGKAQKTVDTVEKKSKIKKSKKTERNAEPKIAKFEKLKDGNLKFDNVLPLDEAAGYCEDILAGLAAGNIRFHKGKKKLVIRPNAECRIKIKAARKGKKERVKFDISWRQSS